MDGLNSSLGLTKERINKLEDIFKETTLNIIKTKAKIMKEVKKHWSQTEKF